jgi:hypothetical protein
MSQEIKKARLRMEAQDRGTIDICMKCLRDCEACDCGVSVGKLMTLREWRERVDAHLGAVRA